MPGKRLANDLNIWALEKMNSTLKWVKPPIVSAPDPGGVRFGAIGTRDIPWSVVASSSRVRALLTNPIATVGF